MPLEQRARFITFDSEHFATAKQRLVPNFFLLRTEIGHRPPSSMNPLATRIHTDRTEWSVSFNKPFT